MMLSRRNALISGIGVVAAGHSILGSGGFAATENLPSCGFAVLDVYFDDHGLIVQRDCDGGDTAQREGWVWFGQWVRSEVLSNPWHIQLPISYEETMRHLELGQTGTFRRHPTQGGWKSEASGFSRDQIIPLIASMGVWQDRTRLQRSQLAWSSCNLLLQCVQETADVVGPELKNHYRRALEQPVDDLGDSWLVGGIATRLSQAAENPNDVGDDLNLVIYLLLAALRQPTALLDNARLSYARSRAVSSGCYLAQYRAAYPGDYTADELTMTTRIEAGRGLGWVKECAPVLGALRWYFRVESGGSPGLAELYEPMVVRWFPGE